MDFRIADTFTDSLARLTGDEQKAVKTTAFDLQLNPTNPGMQFHQRFRHYGHGRQPDSAARAYLTVIAKEPAVVRRALASE